MDKKVVEKRLWDVLEMDDFGKSLIDADRNSALQFGTGHTVNACNQCDNSLAACTAGEANCNPGLFKEMAKFKEVDLTR